MYRALMFLCVAIGLRLNSHILVPMVNLRSHVLRFASMSRLRELILILFITLRLIWLFLMLFYLILCMPLSLLCLRWSIFMGDLSALVQEFPTKYPLSGKVLNLVPVVDDVSPSYGEKSLCLLAEPQDPDSHFRYSSARGRRFLLLFFLAVVVMETTHRGILHNLHPQVLHNHHP